MSAVRNEHVLKERLGSRRRRELSNDEKQEIKESFELFDSDKDKLIDYHELKVALKALGFEMKKAEVLRILRDYDRENTGKIGLEEFTEVASDLMLSRDPYEQMTKAFQLFDDDGSGKISLRNLRRVARDLGEEINEDELRAMIDEFDLDQDGEISMEEFVSIMTGDAL